MHSPISLYSPGFSHWVWYLSCTALAFLSCLETFGFVFHVVCSCLLAELWVMESVYLAQPAVMWLLGRARTCYRVSCSAPELFLLRISSFSGCPVPQMSTFSHRWGWTSLLGTLKSQGKVHCSGSCTVEVQILSECWGSGSWACYVLWASKCLSSSPAELSSGPPFCWAGFLGIWPL